METGSVLLIGIFAAIVLIAIAVFRKAVLTSRIEAFQDRPRSGGSLEEGIVAVVSKTLRPVGVIEVGNIPYEAISEGEFIEPGTRVMVIGKAAGKALVRKR